MRRKQTHTLKPNPYGVQLVSCGDVEVYAEHGNQDQETGRGAPDGVRVGYAQTFYERDAAADFFKMMGYVALDDQLLLAPGTGRADLVPPEIFNIPMV